MGVVRHATAARWAVALGGTLAIGLLPAAVAALPVDDSGRSPQQLVRLARDSASIAHEGYAETSGTLGLPDLPRFGEVAALLGGTSQVRVWWRSPRAWRVDRVTPTGETGSYLHGDLLRTWDFETQQARMVRAATPVRLPRVDDLLPPQAARRILAGTTSRDRLEPLPARRVARHAADGVRIIPAQRESTVGHVDLWVDDATGLPVRLDVFARGARSAALRSRFLDLRVRRPSAAVLRPRYTTSVRRDVVVIPDLASAIDLYAPYELPPQLGPFLRSRNVLTLGGTATYGEGLARFVLLPLPPDLGREAYAAATDGGGQELDVHHGVAVLTRTPLVNAVVARSDTELGSPGGRRGRSYLLAGTVDERSLTIAVNALFLAPPEIR